MKTLFAIFLVSLTVLVAGFGAYLMAHSDSEPHNGCLPGILEGVRCETNLGPFESATFHVRALSQPFLAGPLGAVLMLLLLAQLVILATRESVLPESNSLLPRLAFASAATPSEISLRSWLAIHEKRDPSI